MRTPLRMLLPGLLAWVFFMASPLGQAARTPPQATGAGSMEGVVLDPMRRPLAGVQVALEQAGRAQAMAVTDREGRFRFAGLAAGAWDVRAALAGFRTMLRSVTVTGAVTLTVEILMQPGPITETVVVRDEGRADAARQILTAPVASPAQMGAGGRGGMAFAAESVVAGGFVRYAPFNPNTEAYAVVEPNRFKLSAAEPLSTFAADVDTASYTNVRRFLNGGTLPPPEAVRVEEFINYFHYQYPDPRGEHPVSVTTEVGDAPWAPGHRLVLVGVKAQPIEQRAVAARNLVLLIDVSGSMNQPDKLPLVKTALRMFVDTLRDDDRVAIVVYAGASGCVLPSTPARQRQRIHDAIEALHAGGSTNGGEGLVLAYTIAEQEFIKGGVNRVILATDGDFNVGVTSQGDLVRLIEEKRASGVFLSILGVGRGNLKDATVEMLANKGNGHYAYLDSLQEARRVLVREGGATLETVAKDVKFQVEFNPATVAAWRLIGYENRLLAHQDFNDDRKDGGELGAGHTVTVLYEVVPVGRPLPKDLVGEDGRPLVDPLTYQTSRQPSGGSRDLLTVKIRYKQPDGDTSTLLTAPVREGGAASNLAFAAAVAEFGLLLRDPKSAEASWTALTKRVQTLAPGPAVEAADRQGFAEIVELAAGLRRLTK